MRLLGAAGAAPEWRSEMVTAGHMACEAVTAMRSLSSALQLRHHQEGAARHHPGRRGRRHGDAWRHRGGRQRGHAASDQASACPHGPAGPGRGRGWRRVRAGGPGGVCHRADHETGKVTGARQVPGTGPQEGPAPGGRPACGQRSRRARRRASFRSAARAEPHERVHTGRPDRRAQGRAPAGKPGHPGNIADRRARAGPGRTGPGITSRKSAGRRSAGRRPAPGPAAAWPGRSPVPARLPAGDGPGRSRPAAVCSRRPAAASDAVS
jgi:hypothetical protein